MTTGVVRLEWRSAAVLAATTVVGIGAFVWPLLVRVDGRGANLAHSVDAPWLMVALVPLLVAVVVTEMTAGRLDAKSVALLGVLAAVGTAMRLPTGGIAGLELVFFVFLPAGRVFGRAFGFVLGALTIFASALVIGGIGPWLPFQMLAAGWVGFGAGCLPRARGRAELVLLGAYGVMAGLAYGIALDLWFWPFTSGSDSGVSFVAGAPLSENLRRFWGFHLATALGFDLMRGLSTALLVAVLGRPVLAALRRARRRAAFDAPADFASSAEGAAGQAGPVGDHAVDPPRPEREESIGVVDGPHVDGQAGSPAPLDHRLADHRIPWVDGRMAAVGAAGDGIDGLVGGEHEPTGGNLGVQLPDPVDDPHIERRHDDPG